MSLAQIYGIHAVSRRIERAAASCLALYCSENPGTRVQRVIDSARRAGIEVRFEDRGRLAARCGSDKHQGCVLATRMESPVKSLQQCLEAIDDDSLLLVLDGIQDPHNLGACLRTADACGVDAVIIPKDRSVGLNATVRKVAAGAAETVPLVEVTNLGRSLKALKKAGVWITAPAGMRHRVSTITTTAAPSRWSWAPRARVCAA